MYVDPFWFGVICTIGIEIGCIIALAFYYGRRK